MVMPVPICNSEDMCALVPKLLQKRNPEFGYPPILPRKPSWVLRAGPVPVHTVKMRPTELNPLFAPAISLPGIGPKLLPRLEKLLGRPDVTQNAAPRIIDLVWHLPTGVIDRSFQPKIAQLTPGTVATLRLEIDTHDTPPKRGSRRPYRVHAHDDTGSISLVFFHAHTAYLKERLPEGGTRYVSGKVEFFDGQPQMSHPDYLLSEAEFGEMPLFEPVYPMTAGLAAKTLQKSINGALERIPDIPEWQDPAWRNKQKWPDFMAAVRQAHAPQNVEDVEPLSQARARLAYDELLANQLALGLIRAHIHKTAGRVLTGDGKLRGKITAVLPFALTKAQQGALAEIDSDMAAETRMLRLLQGDVGSGKTVVALLAMVNAIEAGHQAAFMAPTEILARQHLATLRPLCAVADIKVALLTGREKGAVRRSLLADLAAGHIHLLIGTHALFQEGVEFNDLAIAVIDEQHRFGVHQRLALQAKGPRGVDVLVMTATPIPRTLTLTLYGDMDVSKILEKPAGRTPIETRVMPADRLRDVILGLQRALDQKARIYWICPLVEDSEEIEAVSAEDRFETLSQIYPGRCGLVHGRMKGGEKDDVMARFQSGEIDILVATTVVEVGVDVPEATIMVIEHAERFGLAQLHQLRGRVGRGAQKSSCVLLYKPGLSQVAEARLKIMRESDDGFVIAEEDLRLRGGGEVLGVRQSGTPGFKLAVLDAHGALLAAAHDDARLILSKDPLLKSDRGAALKTVLYLFERDEAVRLLGAG